MSIHDLYTITPQQMAPLFISNKMVILKSAQLGHQVEGETEHHKLRASAIDRLVHLNLEYGGWILFSLTGRHICFIC